MMDASDWAAVSAGISAAAALVALGNSTIALKVARIQTRLADFNNCFEVLKQIGEGVRRVKSDDAESQAREIRELLNLFEVLALLVNKKQLGDCVTYVAKNYLIETWVWFQITEGLSDIVADAITGPKTFQQLLLFRQRNAEAIEGLLNARRLTNPAVEGT